MFRIIEQGMVCSKVAVCPFDHLPLSRCSNPLQKQCFSYFSASGSANFGCANDFAVPFGSMTCGDGPGFINTQGCSMANTASGPCYFCCCRGGSCNHPAVFAREAQRLPTFPQGFQQLYFGGGHSLSSLSSIYRWLSTARPFRPIFLKLFIKHCFIWSCSIIVTAI
ncbi:unnamed protein product [Haemonchus placei]|uniref:ET module n=1 Tax=Haemonchus placei TaxID=6290 RepID=A0A0N4WJB0_HAEPC|nr:unnamed protein product [Haemonchus placei]